MKVISFIKDRKLASPIFLIIIVFFTLFWVFFKQTMVLESPKLTYTSTLLFSESSIISPWKHSSLKCNIIFVKLPKTASSTVAGISRQIAAHSDIQYSGVFTKSPKFRSHKLIKKCKVLANHLPKPYKLTEVTDRDLREKTYLFSVVRDPTDRVLSQFFHFEVSRKDYPTDDESIIKYMAKVYTSNYLTTWLGSFIPVCRRSFKNVNLGMKCVNKIMDEYDFIGVAERLDESMVVLKILLNVSFADILYVKGSKQNASYDDLGFKIIKQPVSEGVKRYLNQIENSFTFFFDREVLFAANKRLDATISSFGKDIFKQQIDEYLELKQDLSEYCRGRVHTPYNSLGKRDRESKGDCYWNDNGCGLNCIEEFISRLPTG